MSEEDHGGELSDQDLDGVGGGAFAPPRLDDRAFDELVAELLSTRDLPSLNG